MIGLSGDNSWLAVPFRNTHTHSVTVMCSRHLNNGLDLQSEKPDTGVKTPRSHADTHI
jgi:hypothetical protein